MSERLRLRDVDPEALASSMGLQLVHHAAQILSVASTELPTALAALARYARGDGLPAGKTVAELLQSIAPLYRSLLRPDVMPEDSIEPKPTSPLAIVVAAAAARAKLDDGQEIACTELALLTGIHRDHLTTMAAKIPSAYRVNKTLDSRRPWRFKPSRALKQWIQDRANM